MKLSSLHADPNAPMDSWQVRGGGISKQAHLNDLASKGLHVLARAENAVHQDCRGRSLARLDLAPPHLKHSHQLASFSKEQEPAEQEPWSESEVELTHQGPLDDLIGQRRRWQLSSL